MKKKLYISILICFLAGGFIPSNAEFLISSAIIEFNGTSEKQQDIELVSRSEDNDYIITEVNEVLNPGSAQETRRLIEDPAQGGLLVTPDKTILAGGNRKVMRFVLLKDPDESEHIYRVAVKPVIKGVENNAQVGLKVLIGYEVLVIVRPKEITTSYEAVRNGTILSVVNNGNSNILLQNGKQCEGREECKLPPVLRVYAGQAAHVELPLNMPVTYSVWDGKEVTEKHFE